ncbi:MAG TPA: LPS assembly protein LptD [Stellaceae bacterium]|nr:LPS assembly protein LptD [Stellaceae bacterium]
MARRTWADIARVATLGYTVAAVFVADPPSASAQTDTFRDRKSTADDKNAPAVFSADDVTYDNELALVVARGHVEVSQAGRTVFADTVTYNQKTDTVTASGHVSMLEPTGEVVFGNYVELTDSMRDAFIKDARMLLSDRSRLVGNTARRLNGDHTEIMKGVYSPCDLCKDDPTSPPLWQLKAAKITHDKENQLIEYNNVVMEIAGVPIFYSPYLSQPDPSVKRSSGLLAPLVGSNTNLGAFASIPYYWAIDGSKDATFQPLFTSNAGTVLGGEYRQRFTDGYIYGRGSFTTTTDASTINKSFRGNISSNGEFDLNENYRTGFDIQRVSDVNYLSYYRFGTPANFLTSRAYLEDFDERSFGSINAYSFQSLRSVVSDGTQPIILPVLDYTYVGRPDAWGGRLSVNNNVLDLIGQSTPSYRRYSTGATWERPFTTSDGSVFKFTGSTRGDAYSVSDVRPVSTDTPTSATNGRVFPQLSLNWRYPLVRYGKNTRVVIQPIVSLIAAPNGGNPSTIPNQDSQAFDFDDSDLFVPNRLTGYDQVDSGQRADYGLSAAMYDQAGNQLSFLVGQSYRLQKYDNLFPTGTGLSRQLSDYVGRVQISPNSYFDTYYRFRLDQQDLRVHRQEVGINTGPQRLRLGVNFAQITANPRDGVTNRQQVSANATIGLTPYWTVSLSGTRDLGNFANGTLSSSVTASYQDECMTVITSLSQSNIINSAVTPGTTITFQVVFKNLGQVLLPSFQTNSQ